MLVLVRTSGAGIPRNQRYRDFFRGAGILGAGGFTYFLPLSLWVIAILGLLALWMIASAILLLKRVAKGRQAVPEGFYSRMAIGLLSLVTTTLLLASPAAVLGLLVEILGAITVLLGLTLGINGLRLRQWMNRVPTA